MQVQLLRSLKEKLYEPLGGVETPTANVRVAAATNRHLAALMAADRCRGGPSCRINVIRLEMSRLRERLADVSLPAVSFLRQLLVNGGKVVEGVSPPALRRPIAYPFPGNVREQDDTLRTGLRLEHGCSNRGGGPQRLVHGSHDRGGRLAAGVGAPHIDGKTGGQPCSSI